MEEITKGVKKPVIVDDHKAVAHFMNGDSLVSEGVSDRETQEDIEILNLFRITRSWVLMICATEFG